MKRKYVVDGLEPGEAGLLARLEREDGEVLVLPAAELPGELHEGAVLSHDEAEDCWETHAHEEAERRDKAQARLDRLNKPAGGLKL